MAECTSIFKNEDLKNNFQEAKTKLRRYIFFLFIVITYTGLGALLFFYIEECYDVVPKTVTEAEFLLRSLCHNLSTKQHLFNRTTFYDAWMFCRKHGDTAALENCNLDIKKFSKWFSYTVAVVTTIGFGDVVTRSDTAKIVTMVYALPGIAIAAGTYIPAARGIIALTKCALNIIEMKCFKKTKISNCPLKIFLIQTILVVLYMLVSASIYTFDELENYSLLNAIYFTFTTLTTIGFGDFTFKVDKYLTKPYLFIVTALLFSTGLGMFASLVSSLTDVFSLYAAKKLKTKTTGSEFGKKKEADEIPKSDAATI